MNIPSLYMIYIFLSYIHLDVTHLQMSDVEFAPPTFSALGCAARIIFGIYPVLFHLIKIKAVNSFKKITCICYLHMGLLPDT